MRTIDSGKTDNTDLAALKSNMTRGQILFVDMWGNWHRYDQSYYSFLSKLDLYIQYRKWEIDYFNHNYIQEIFIKD
jgi:hypothetical protein